MTFTAFFDDAALFPPGNAPMEVAVTEHLRRRHRPDGRYVGPFVCPATRLGELVAALGDAFLEDASLEVSLVGHLAGPLPAGLTLVATEVGDVRQRPCLPSEVPVFVERPWGRSYDVPAGTTLKLRCGGRYVPSIDELAGAIRHCVAASRPFKLTAGLHRAVRSQDNHGFVNVMAAVVEAGAGRDPAPVLAATDADLLDLDAVGEARTLFRSIGTCSIEEPLADLRTLGLIA